MAINSTVRWFLSTMPGAPELRDQPGGIINVLDACLMNGFASKTVNTLTVVSGVATLNISGGHDYQKHAVIRIAGADPAPLNGDWRIATVPDGSNLTFACPGIADVAATGTMTAIRATPGFWEKAFSDTHKGAYRSTHEDATGLYLRMDDSPTGVNASPVRGYETMTGIDAGTNPFPTVAQAPNFVWRRTDTASAGSLPRPWALVADEAWFCLLLNFVSNSATRAVMYQFGDAVDASPLDAFAAIIGANAADNPSSPSTGAAGLARFDGGGTAGQYFARPVNQTVAPVSAARYGHSRPAGNVSDGEAFPAARSNGFLWVGPASLHDGSAALRGLQPGYLQGLTAGLTTLASDVDVRVLDPTADQPHAVLAYPVNNASNANSYIGIDIWGPWR